MAHNIREERKLAHYGHIKRHDGLEKRLMEVRVGSESWKRELEARVGSESWKRELMASGEGSIVGWL